MEMSLLTSRSSVAIFREFGGQYRHHTEFVTYWMRSESACSEVSCLTCQVIVMEMANLSRLPWSPLCSVLQAMCRSMQCTHLTVKDFGSSSGPFSMRPVALLWIQWSFRVYDIYIPVCLRETMTAGYWSLRGQTFSFQLDLIGLLDKWLYIPTVPETTTQKHVHAELLPLFPSGILQTSFFPADLLMDWSSQAWSTSQEWLLVWISVKETREIIHCDYFKLTVN